MSRTQDVIKNIKYALIGQTFGLVVSFISRWIFVRILSYEYLGLNGLFSNILNILSLAEMGIGSSIIFSLYKPIAECDKEKIKSLMRLYKYAYSIIGCAVLLLGLVLTPFLHTFIKDMPKIRNIYGIYVLYVLNSSFSYFFTYKRSLIIASQQRYITTIYRYVSFCTMNVIQIIVLIETRSFVSYYSIQIVFTVLENIMISKKAEKMFPYLNEKNIQLLSSEDIVEIKKNVFAMVFHKVGTVIVNGTDNILISKIVGIISVGVYSNYLLIRQAIDAVTLLIFQSVTASIGNLSVKANSSKKLQVFERLDFIGAWIFGLSSISLWCLYNSFIEIWLGDKYLFDSTIVLLIVSNFYINGMRKAVLTARDAMGLFWYDRYKPIAEIIINFVISVILGFQWGVSGILVGTFISTTCTCFWIEPFILYRYGLNAPLSNYFVRYIQYTSVTIVVGLITKFFCRSIPCSNLLSLIYQILICIIIPNLLFLIIYFKRDEMKYIFELSKKILIRNFP